MDFVSANRSYHKGLLTLKDVEYVYTESYPTAAMLSSVITAIHKTARIYRLGVKYGMVISRVIEYCALGYHILPLGQT